MDELSEKLERVYTIIKFILGGPFILYGSCCLDLVKFWRNLYTKPLDADLVLDPRLLTRQSIELFVKVCQ